MRLKIFLMQQKKLIQNLNNLKEKKFFFYIFIIINSLIITTYYGYRGIFPIDSFLIFDSGYNVSKNFHPFKDYWTITGPLLDYLQSFLFLIFDISWLSYVIHAAIVNTVLAVFIFYFFNKLKLHQNLSLIYATAISILAYPSTGTPFVDHHAVIFCLVSICFFIIGVKQKRKKFWFLSSFFIVLSFFSKQIPSAYLIFLILISIISYKTYFKEKNFDDVLSFILGGIMSASIFLIIFLLNEVPIKNFFIQYIYYPMTLGDNRIDNLKFDFKNTIGQFKFIYFALIPLLFIIFSILKNKQNNYDKKKDLFIIVFILLTSLVFIYGQLLTKNQVLIFFLIPFYLGFCHIYVIKYFKKKHFIFFIIFILSISLTKYHIRFNHNKKFMELENVDFNLAINAKKIDNKLSNLKWITPEYPETPQQEINYLNEAKNILTNDKTAKILITDYLFLPAIINNTNASPNKWYDDLSVPSKESKFFNQYKDFYLSRIKLQKIKNIYTIGSDKEKYIEVVLDKDCYDIKKMSKIVTKISLKRCTNFLDD